MLWMYRNDIFAWFYFDNLNLISKQLSIYSYKELFYFPTKQDLKSHIHIMMRFLLHFNAIQLI